jgi:hypothetical protein
VKIAQDPDRTIDTLAPELMLRVFELIGVPEHIILSPNILFLSSPRRGLDVVDGASIEGRFELLFNILSSANGDVKRVVVNCRKGYVEGRHYLTVCLDRSDAGPSSWDITVFNPAMLDGNGATCFEASELRQLFENQAKDYNSRGSGEKISFNLIIYQLSWGLYKQSSNTACGIAMWLNTQSLLDQHLPGYAGKWNDFNTLPYQDMWMRERYLQAYYAALLHSYAAGNMRKEGCPVNVQEGNRTLVLENEHPWAMLYKDSADRPIDVDISWRVFPPRPQNQVEELSQLPQLPPLSPEWKELANSRAAAVAVTHVDNFPTRNRVSKVGDVKGSSGYAPSSTAASSSSAVLPMLQPQPLLLSSGIIRECINTGLLTNLLKNPEYKKYSEALKQLFADMCSYVYERFSSTTFVYSAKDMDGFFGYWMNVGGEDLGNKMSAREDVLRQCASGKYNSILDGKSKDSTTGTPCKVSRDIFDSLFKARDVASSGPRIIQPSSKPLPSQAPHAVMFSKSPVPATPSAQLLNDKEITIKLDGGIVKERLGALDRKTSDDSSLKEVINAILLSVMSMESDSIFSFSKKRGQFQNLIQVICSEPNRKTWYDHLLAAANGIQRSGYNYSSLGYSFTGGILLNGLMENAIVRCLALIIDFKERNERISGIALIGSPGR